MEILHTSLTLMASCFGCLMLSKLIMLQISQYAASYSAAEILAYIYREFLFFLIFFR